MNRSSLPRQVSDLSGVPKAKAAFVLHRKPDQRHDWNCYRARSDRASRRLPARLLGLQDDVFCLLVPLEPPGRSPAEPEGTGRQQRNAGNIAKDGAIESIEAWEVAVLAKANSFLRAKHSAALKLPAPYETDQLQSLKTHEREGFARAFCDLESDVCDLTRMARLAQLQVHEPIGELKYEEGTCVEVPDTERVGLATFAVSLLTEKVRELERKWYRRFNGAVEAARNPR
jgi:hypothetical protein